MSLDIYTTDRKKKLAAKISEIRSKPDLKKIKTIIFEENPDVSVNKDSGGMLMFFQNLTPTTYARLEKYIRDMEIRKLNMQTELITKTSEKFLSESSDVNNLARTRYRYSNKEKDIMRKKEYDHLVTSEQKLTASCSNDTLNCGEKQPQKKTIFSKTSD